ncbi:hypothetical protein GGR53DRAFT_523447 [Hypoxylon sp. FL1150]|nr:hypothetical protein GGR53DRAFT_523447 [Hypoxylon sp. FL1150]
MPEEERRARQQRRRRFLGFPGENRRRKEKQDNKAEIVEPNTPQETTGQDATDYEPRLTEAEAAVERKPWETIVIGADLGDNLSNIESKNREIAQQRYIVEHFEEHSPHQVPHQRRLLEKMMGERVDMPDNEENRMPENQREEQKRVDDRLALLNWGLQTCQCEDEEVNIRAALEGYRTKKIPYSDNYTLIYAGHIVDFCPTYRSFCIDRRERLDRYYARFGPGWLWHEPPLSVTGDGPLAMKGTCLEREGGENVYNIGHYSVNMNYEADRSLVTRGTMRFNPQTDEKYAQGTFKMLLDSGATFPILSADDLATMEVDFRWYPAQGIMRIASLTTTGGHRFFEMTVSVRGEHGEPIIGEGDKAVWPDENRLLGGLYPVLAGARTPMTRLSGMVPFEACYMSSVPTMGQFWLGEDRRDVLGSSRMPAHQRYDGQSDIQVAVPEELEDLRYRQSTPDRVIFEHYLEEDGKVLFDIDLSKRGVSQLMVAKRESQGPHKPPKTIPTHGIILEPRINPRKVAPLKVGKTPMTLWRQEFISDSQLRTHGYRGVPISTQVGTKRKRTQHS